MAERTLKVLLIEDNPADARLIRAMLKGLREGVFELESADRTFHRP